ncbi:hypothetical protein [Polynucleobacter kasalickyi]|uniref:Uncharacterized protein n=1 Tax=Polynucleobacter kasalickyi TaxID=1938817 RepID=A0A1W2CCD7_9BURK|nr:hypothetical protein [Polynucleobacter kasalickyi]SMC82925.1 hypothetical protein SAMN06296008_1224 [Polynucleobacter kasalickyi]
MLCPLFSKLVDQWLSATSEEALEFLKTENMMELVEMNCMRPVNTSCPEPLIK